MTSRRTAIPQRDQPKVGATSLGNVRKSRIAAATSPDRAEERLQYLDGSRNGQSQQGPKQIQHRPSYVYYLMWDLQQPTDHGRKSTLTGAPIRNFRGHLARPQLPRQFVSTVAVFLSQSNLILSKRTNLGFVTLFCMPIT